MFSAQLARAALEDILQTLNEPGNAAKVHEATERSGNDMLKFMQFVFPLISQIQMVIIGKYGFSADGEGLIRFSQVIKHYEQEDEDIAALSQQLRQIQMPPLSCEMPPRTPQT